ncbi:TraR/DksA family transcriptional regulator [Parasphingopyxis algicola]|uniref:TraR/DksA family transcriptional regulator n=1 Tax=Parasphingopyxis algicola TaxID=2026624 RepID=UPI00159F705A|nr:TraR/DksA family transcriptional regulator [Parasphingopyxis algicola]QLC25831.1 TraR/DksA family transcriptional regulator [Parasphingopyxis algicola]
MTDLSDTRIAHFRAKLVALRAQLSGEDAGAAEWRKPVELDQQSVGRLSRMDAMQQQAMADAEARRRQSDIARIDAALRRIDEGEYGWCLSCGEAIAAKRLEIDPMATQCVACAS